MRSTAKPFSGLKKVTRSTSPAISSDGTRGWGEEVVILIEVYAVDKYDINPPKAKLGINHEHILLRLQRTHGLRARS
jgi:hypothetical protein